MSEDIADPPVRTPADFERDQLRAEILKLASERDEWRDKLFELRAAIRRAWGVSRGEVKNPRRVVHPRPNSRKRTE